MGNFVEDKNTTETILCQNTDDHHYLYKYKCLLFLKSLNMLKLLI